MGTRCEAKALATGSLREKGRRRAGRWRMALATGSLRAGLPRQGLSDGVTKERGGEAGWP